MNDKFQLGLQGGILVLFVVVIVVGGYFVDQTRQQSQTNSNLITVLDNKVDQFLTKWDERSRLTNSVNNETEHQLLELAHNASAIFEKQIMNENNIQNNLTAHRLVTNSSILEIKKALDEHNNLTKTELNAFNNLTLQNQQKTLDLLENNTNSSNIGKR